ncbi:hypothetical protein [Streptomyces sp. 1222.5]|uniref:hypothetical protein n=1 Tax=Streptomyces sp. 1222.5 TaxID=1881026 RepID=UPI003D75B9B8
MRSRASSLAPRSTSFWVLVLAVSFALIQLANVTGRDTPDSKNYLAYALSLRGEAKKATAAAVIDYTCEGVAARASRTQSVDPVRFQQTNPGAQAKARCQARMWHEVRARLQSGQKSGHTLPFTSQRFMRIFEVRPGYPVLLVPFVTLLGATWGMWAAGVLVTVLGGVLVFLILRSQQLPAPIALTGQAFYYVLPCGTTAMRPMTEGLMLVLTLTAVWGGALLLNGRTRHGIACVAGALLALFAVKHSQALFLGACLAAACAVLAQRKWRQAQPRRRLLALTAVCCGAVLGTMLAARALHYPSETDSLQDLLTNHYALPDRTHPWQEFFALETRFWPEWVRRQMWQPLFAVLLAAGVWGVLLRRRSFGVHVMAAALTGFLNQAAHPDITVGGERLIVMAWLLPVLGVPALLHALHRRLLPRNIPAPRTAVAPNGPHGREYNLTTGQDL